jgi:hypothetical protein
MKLTILKVTTCTLLAVCIAFVLVTTALAQSQAPQKNAAPTATLKSFATPQDAAQALIRAATAYDVQALLELFGPDGKDLVSSADPVRDKNNAAAFVAKAAEKNAVTLDRNNQNRAILSVGTDEWPLPVPLVKRGGKWYFDAKAGRNEILFRRIGANELDAIQVCRGYVEAQQEYAAQVHDNAGIHQYAQKIISSPGKQDGLYWINADGTPGGPISEGIARAIQEGYKAEKGPYHGYYFKILKGQGPAAPLGTLDYVIQGAMIGGFALVAVPAEYRVTGVQTFLVSQDGIVYQKDLGPDSLSIARNMQLYNPDKTWRRTDDQWSASVSDKTSSGAKP